MDSGGVSRSAMPAMPSRRTFLSFAAAALASGCSLPKSPPAATAPHAPAPRASPFAAMEQRLGGRVGVFMLDSGTGTSLQHRADERFAMCSTFKWGLAAAVLAGCDRGELALSEPIAFGREDLLEYAPVTRSRVAEGRMMVEDLARAAVTVSDNTAANLLLARIGGPPGLARFFRGFGDNVTRLDRNEPTLNTNLAGDPRDTTSPRAMVGALANVLGSRVLATTSRERLIGWLVDTRTGLARLRAGLPPGWRAGDKTGTGNNGACNDVAVIWPPQGAPRFVAAYLSESVASLEELEAAHAEIGRLVATM